MTRKRAIVAVLLLAPLVVALAFVPKALILFGVYIGRFDVGVESHISLTVGHPFELDCAPASGELAWKSDNPLVSIIDRGIVVAHEAKGYPESQASVTARSADTGEVVCSYSVTVVPWVANRSSIEIVDIVPKYRFLGLDFYPPHRFLKIQWISDLLQSFLPTYRILGSERDLLYFAINKELHATSDGLKTSKLLAHLPFRPAKARMLITPFGYFLRSGTCVYWSRNLIDWDCTLQTAHQAWLMDNMDYWYEEDTGKGYVFVKEYSAHNPGHRHHLYRGIFSPSAGLNWAIVLTLRSIDEQEQKPEIFLSAGRHFHLVKVDPFTGNIWVGTGDRSVDSMIMYSRDLGESFEIVGFGQQDFRTLGFWFTERFIYWNMDSDTPPQRVFRINREELSSRGTLTPMLSEGKTRVGVGYFVVKAEDIGYFPVGPGRRFVEVSPRDLSDANQVIAIDDDRFDYRETVAALSNGSHFSIFPSATENGTEVIVMAATAEGFESHGTRDARGRLFGLQELESGEVIVQELLAIPPFRSGFELARIEAVAQDSHGLIYFASFGTQFADAVTIGRLRWAHER